jgi:hypothetical protein
MAEEALKKKRIYCNHTFRQSRLKRPSLELEFSCAPKELYGRLGEWLGLRVCSRLEGAAPFGF